MKRIEKRHFYLINRRLGLLTFCLFIGIYVANSVVLARNDSAHFSEKINLAMRRTVHHLLKQNGDSTSRIPPVQQLDANTFVVSMDHLFEYDQLPTLLQESLQLHGIKPTYDVTILDCRTSEILLGYTQQDLFQQEGIPCRSRKQVPGCYQLKVSFQPEAGTNAATSWWILPLVLIGLGYIVWHRNKRTTPTIQTPLTDSNTVSFSNSVWDPTTLRLISGESSHQLTYREAKLLNLLLAHQNQVLERDFILKSVWEDEGIVVGRSLDVFISRLRKMLVNDVGIKLAAVHGIGYRLEVPV